jgi:hypothetical protein
MFWIGSAIYNMKAAGAFPKSVKLGARAMGWLDRESNGNGHARTPTHTPK